MVVAPSETNHWPAEIPTVDWKDSKGRKMKLIAKACEELGFFKLINYTMPKSVDENLESIAVEFFSKTVEEKRRARPSPASSGGALYPFGYGVKNIGLRGDIGELEYLLLPTNPASLAEIADTVFDSNTARFTKSVSRYVQSMSSLSTQVLQMLAGGLGLSDASFAVHLTRGEPDSLLRLNHYPPCQTTAKNKDCKKSTSSVRFGEHTDPQMITILRSDDVPGLQIQTVNSAWFPVQPDPDALFIFVGDTIQALTNGRIKSVRHRVIANSYSCSRLSFAFFCAPGLKDVINPNFQMITPQNPRRYKSFTWEEYKRVMYTMRLAHNRLDLFHVNDDEQDSE